MHLGLDYETLLMNMCIFCWGFVATFSLLFYYYYYYHNPKNYIYRYERGRSGGAVCSKRYKKQGS